MKSFFKDTLIYGSSDFVMELLAFFTFPIIANLLTPTEFGLLTLILTITSIVSLFVNMGISNSVQRFYFEKPEEKINSTISLVSTSYWMQIVIGLFFLLVSLILAIGLKDVLFDKYAIKTQALLYALIAVFPAQINQYCSNVLRLHFKPLKFFFLSFLNNLFGVILGIIFLNNGMGLEGIFIAQLITGLGLLPFSAWLIRSELKLTFEKKIAKKVFDFGYPFIAAGIGYWIFSSVDKWLLSDWFGNEETGLYSIALKFAMIIFYLNSAFGQAWSPLSIKAATEEPEKAPVFFGRVLTMYFCILVLASCGIMLFSRDFIHLTTPKSYWGAIQMVPFLTAAYVMSATNQITLIGITMSKKTNFMSIAVFISTVISVILNFILIRAFRGVGGGIALLVTHTILTLVYLLIGQKVFPIVLELRKLISLGIAFVVCIVISFYLPELQNITYSILLNSFIFIAFLCLFLVLKIIRPSEIIKMLVKP